MEKFQTRTYYYFFKTKTNSIILKSKAGEMNIVDQIVAEKYINEPYYLMLSKQ